MKLGNSMRKLRLSSNSMVMIKAGTEIAKQENIDKLVSSIEGTSLSNVIIVIVDDFSDIDFLNEASMNQHGWFRANHLAKIIHTKPTTDENEDGQDGHEG